MCHIWCQRPDPPFEVYQKEDLVDVPLTCRLCDQAEETIDQIVSACPELELTEHLSRHNSVAKVILRAILRANGKEFLSRWWYERQDALIKLSDAGDHYVQWEPKFLKCSP